MTAFCRCILALLLMGLCQTAAMAQTPTAAPEFLPEERTFNVPIAVTLSAGEGTTIYYTTNGATPTVSEENKYTAPIVISATTTFTAIAVDAEGNASSEVTATYTCTRHGIGEGYDPSSPANPGEDDTVTPVKKYRLTTVCNPSAAGSAYSGSSELAEGAQTYVRTYSNSGFKFQNWTIEGTEVSTESSFNYVMPDHDVALVANYTYDPTSPGNPSPSGTFDMEENTSRWIYAYPNSGWKFVGWTINGEQQEQTSTSLEISMGEKALDIAAYFTYEPSAPSNPGANYYNSVTGQVIMDDFTSGNLYSGLSTLVGSSNFANVSSVIVKGMINSSDVGSLSNLSNIGNIDLSRTGGLTSISSYAFENTTASSIILPSTVTSLSSYVFYGCTNLVSLTTYALEPPVCNSSTFSNFTNKDNCTVFVPETAIELYEAADYWKDFTILPIADEAHVLQVNLPADASDGRYKNNTLEIVNINTAVRQRYVISDRMLYTFNGLQKDEQYNIYMFSQAGLEIGRLENVVIPDQDLEVTFDQLKPLHSVFAKVTDADGTDVTSQVTVEWFKPLADGTRTYLRKAVSLGEIPDGQQLICRVSLDNKLGVAYSTPDDAEFTVSATDNTCTINLTPLRSIELTGTIVDGSGMAMAGASVAVSQTLNGRYTRTFTTKTDRKGAWTLTVLDAAGSQVTFAANECVNVNRTLEAFDPTASTVDLGQVTLKSIVGARVTYGFTYHAAGAEEAEIYYSDYQNVVISVYNVTQDRAHNEVSMQYPTLAVLDENINTGDELRLTATSKTGAFNPMVQTVTVDENQRAEVTFDIIGKGGIAASFEMTDNPTVAAMLYNANGELVKKTTYVEAKTTFTELEDGDYTLVTMGQSDLMNAILRVANFAEIGLTEGKDYVKNTVKVESGKLAEVKLAEVPAFDESLFYYTNSTTGFSANKSSITTGNYLTLRSAIDFKGVYKSGISNVALVVDLPEACDFVAKSVIQGPNLLPYTLDNNRLTVQLGNNYQSQTRFCVVPTAGGSFNATASIVFDYNGKTITQPIGSATSEIKDIAISVPNVIAGAAFKVSGTALSNSTINIYEDGTLLGSGKANSAGTWNVACELANPYNLSTHNIYAEITTAAGITLTSEKKSLTYDVNALQVSKVTMYHWNPETGGWNGHMETSVFDFLNPKTSATKWTVYYPKKKFTYTIEFTDNNPERISNVVLYVHTADGKIVPVNASFDEKKGMWYTEIDMGSSSDGYYPVNCSVDFDYIANTVSDRQLHDEKLQMIEDDRNNIESTLSQVTDFEKEIDELNSKYDEDSAKLATIQNKVSSQTGDLMSKSTLQDLYDVMQWDYSESNFFVDPSVDDSQEFINSLMAEVNEMIDEDIDLAGSQADFEQTISTAENLIKLIDENTAISDESLNNFDERQFVINTAMGDFEYSEVSADAIDQSAWEEDNITEIKLTDGSTLAIYINNDDVIIVDNSQNKAWTLIQQTTASASSRGAQKISGDDIVQNLHKAFVSLDAAKTLITNMIGDWASAVKDDIAKLTSQMDDVDTKLMDELVESSITQQKIEKLERTLQEMGKQVQNGTSANYMGEAVDFNNKINQLKERRNDLLRKADLHSKHISIYKGKINSFKAKVALKTVLLGEIMDYYSIAKGIAQLIDIIQYGIRDMGAWSSLINYILPCDEEEAAALQIKRDAENYRGKWGRGYLGAGTLSLASTGLSGYCAFNDAAKFVMKTVGSFVADFINNTATQIYRETKSNSSRTFNEIKTRRAKLRCKKNCGEPGMPVCPDPPGDGGNGGGGNGGGHGSGSPNDEVQIDPSGFVYEAVPTNRVEGVQASIYYKETKEDMYGDPYEEVILWDAEEYAQKNPLFTDEDGMYQWDVPQGLWQVKFEKDGYQTAFSEWLPVPPPQLDVNIGIVQNKQPEVTEARAYEEGVEVQFDKFMNLETLTTDNIFVSANGQKLAGEIRFVDSSLADEYASEDDADATRYASRVRFVPEQKLSATTGEIRLTVSRNVLSYAGIPMTETYSQVLDVEKEVQTITADDVKVLYGGEKQVTVYALPFEAAVGRTLHIANSSDLITSTDITEATLDAEGKAVVTVKGDLPGRAQLTFSIADVTATGTCAVDVLTEIITAEAPKASRASGTAVYRGTKVELTTESKNATIYFTTDGTCPCDENGTRRKYTVPIIINDDMQILAMTAVGTADEDVSEISEFNYTLKQSDMDFQMAEGWTWISHNFDDAIAPADLAANEGISRILCQTQEAVRDPQLGLVGTLTEMNAAESYKVEAAAATTAQRLTHIARNPATPIALGAGWNWLGYPVSQTMSVNEALATTKAEELDVIVGQNGFAQFDGEQWVGTLETMKPGTGYMYQSQTEKNVVYNTSIVSNAAAKYIPGIADKSPLVIDIHKYGTIMPVIATLNTTDGTPIDNGDYQVAAFCGTECRGIGRVVNGLVMMNVYGNTADPITFRITDAEGEQNFANNASLSFSETVVGNLHSPYAISIDNSATAITDVAYSGNIKVSVENGMLRIKGIKAADINLVEVYDLNGQKIIRERSIAEGGINVSALTGGVYVVVVNGNGEYTYHKIAVR